MRLLEQHPRGRPLHQDGAAGTVDSWAEDLSHRRGEEFRGPVALLRDRRVRGDGCVGGESGPGRFPGVYGDDLRAQRGACSVAQRRAAVDASEPSTPTTILFPAMSSDIASSLGVPLFPDGSVQ